MLDMSKTFWMVLTCLDDHTYQVSSPYKVFNLLAVAMSDKTPLDLWGGVNPQPPLWGAMDTTFHSSEKWKIWTIDAWDNFDNTGKKYFCILKNEVRNDKKSLRGVYTPSKSFSY